MPFDLLNEMPLFTPVAIGLLMGVLSSIFGIGGGVVAVPLLIFAGVPPTVAVGTQAPAQCLTGIVSVRGHMKKGTVDLKFALVMLTGGLTALLLGNILYGYLKQFDALQMVIKGLYVVLMTGIGGSMFVESFLQIIHNKQAEDKRNSIIDKLAHLPFQIKFTKANITVSFLIIFGLGLVAGFLSSLMGVGGGFFLVPAMMYLFSLDGKIAAGTSLAFIIGTSFVSSTVHIFYHHTVDFLLAGLIVVGGFFGARIGLLLLQFIQGPLYRLIFGFFILGLGIAIAVDAFIG